MIEVCRQRGYSIPRDLKIIKPSVGEARDRWLTVEERDLLISCCDDSIRDAVTFLFFTGARPVEIYRLYSSQCLARQPSCFCHIQGTIEEETGTKCAIE